MERDKGKENKQKEMPEELDLVLEELIYVSAYDFVRMLARSRRRDELSPAFMSFYSKKIDLLREPEDHRERVLKMAWRAFSEAEDPSDIEDAFNLAKGVSRYELLERARRITETFERIVVEYVKSLLEDQKEKKERREKQINEKY